MELSEVLRGLELEPLRRGKQFEIIAKNWLLSDPLWSNQWTNVWLWDEWPGRSGADMGVDIVAESNNELWAIQVKCYDPANQIPKSELDSFIAAASPKIFANKMLLATTDRISANAGRALTENGVVRVLRSELEESSIDWGQLSKSASVVKQHLTPRPHQKAAIQKVLEGFDGQVSGQLVMACGTGKTLTSLWVKEELGSQLTLVLVPSLNLLAQTLRSWANSRNTNWTHLCVCSDSSVEQGLDEFVSTTSELPFPVTTDNQIIADFLGGSGERVIFSTYQSSKQIAKACKATGVKFELVICDEAHKLTGKSGSESKTVLDPHAIPRDRILFQTATPRIFDSAFRKKALNADIQIVSMDDKNVFGEVLHSLSFREAIDLGLLADYEVLITGVGDIEIHQEIERRKLYSVKDEASLDASTIASQVGMVRAIQFHQLSRAITFHSSIRRARIFADTLQVVDEIVDEDAAKSRPMRAEVIHGEMDTHQRRTLLRKLEEGRVDAPRLLTNARCLTEGVDIPTLDAVGFIDPKQSTIDIVQAVGRAIRRSENKAKGWIILPVHISEEGLQVDLESTSFQKIWSVINALKAHDEGLVESLDRLRFELGKTGSINGTIPKVTFDFPVSFEKVSEKFVEAITTKIVKLSSPAWEEYFGLLVSYVEENGDATPDQDFVYKERPLGRWVSRQRSELGRKGLSPDLLRKRARIDKVPGWVWDINVASFEKRFAALSKFAETNGHARPHMDTVLDGSQLGDFVRVLRWTHKQGKLPQERVELLESLPGWAWVKYDGDWLDFYASLKEFLETEGRWPGTLGSKSEKSLSMWVNTQRRYKEILSPEKLEALTAIDGWTFEPLSTKWDSNAAVALKLFAETGSISIPRGKTGNFPGYQSWLSSTKNAIRADDIDDARRQKLKPILHLFEIVSAKDRELRAFEKNLQVLEAYLVKGKLSDLQESTVLKGVRIGIWVSNQKQKHKLNKLPEQSASRLEKLPGWSWQGLKEQRWNRSLEELREFERTQRHLLLDAKENKELLQWFQDQKKLRASGNLESQKEELLSDIPGWSWTSAGVSLEAALTHIKTFTIEHGHTLVPQLATLDGFPLGRWVRTIRTLYGKGLLDSETARKIEEVDNWIWNPRNDRKQPPVSK